MDCTELFNIIEYRISVRFARLIHGVPMSFTARFKPMHGIADKTLRIICADHAEAAFCRWHDGINRSMA
jgi:hypothetical protein